MIRRPPRSTLSSSSAASDVYKRQPTKVTFTTTRPVSKKTIESFGYGAANISGNTVSLAVNKPSAIVAFLGNNIDGEIIFLGSDTYEIRKDITKDELNILLASVGGQIEKNGQGEDLYSHTVVPETLELTKTTVSYTHLRAHETRHDLVCRL